MKVHDINIHVLFWFPDILISHNPIMLQSVELYLFKLFAFDNQYYIIMYMYYSGFLFHK